MTQREMHATHQVSATFGEDPAVAYLSQWTDNVRLEKVSRAYDTVNTLLEK
jgi:hypothetical protein